ncbi:MAG: glutamine--fructose-6-phosphate transaminase (isomerizing) [Bacteroidales bacterium]|nr:glutamine--fructose-6-phosphate transaminase (isomerizing) [Candidatus Cryptobacteroides caccocaballi]
MCGIVGYTGYREAYPILIKGLHRLEYRGYDSAGVALLDEKSKLNIYKAQGKVSDLEASTAGKNRAGSLGIAHTRWATHGLPTENNAHPHISESGRLTLVHNGIIENYSTLRDQLRAKGYHFRSETDTEVLVQLIEYIMDTQGTGVVDSVRLALNKVIGAYAIVVIDNQDPDTLVAARKSSPLVIGVGEGNCEFFIASDASPIAEYTSKMVYLSDEQLAVCKRGEELQVLTLDNDEVTINIKNVKLDLSMLDKGGYPHFMQKEIHDQPQCIRDCMRGRIVLGGRRIVLSAVTEHREELLGARRIVIVSCGTSWHAGLIGKQLIEQFCRIPVEVAYASEFRYSDPVIDEKDVVIAISQSGETADTLAAIQLASQRGALVYGIVNAVGSSISRNTDTGTYIHVGPEIGVASTKAFTGQVMVLSMLALALAKEKGTISDDEYARLIDELSGIPEKMEKVLEQDEKIKELAQKYAKVHNMLYLGRGVNYPVALEGSLKLKEISYIHAEGYPAAEMKHGPIALVDEDMPVVFIATHYGLYEKIVSNMQEVIARKGRILAIVTEGDKTVKNMVEDVVEVPEVSNCFSPLLTVLPLQMLAYHVAVAKGLNVDMPRNLAKSVTVE